MSWARTLTLRARELRKNATPAEKKLWSVLRRRSLRGLKFYRQYPIGYYIADFFCPTNNLVIELDGGIHNEAEQKAKDKEREEMLKGTHLQVIRFKNREVLYHLHNVLQQILQECDQTKKIHPPLQVNEVTAFANTCDGVSDGRGVRGEAPPQPPQFPPVRHLPLL